jgi:hypothetical protein
MDDGLIKVAYAKRSAAQNTTLARCRDDVPRTTPQREEKSGVIGMGVGSDGQMGGPHGVRVDD